MSWKKRSCFIAELEYWNDGILKSWKIEILECWKKFHALLKLFIVPIFHRSNIPLFQLSIIPVFLLLLVSCDSELTAPTREIAKNDLYIERAKDVEILYSDSAVVRLSIQAPTLLNHIMSGKEKKEFPDGIKVNFFNGSGQTTSTMIAKSAIQNERDDKIFIRKDVVVTSESNKTLETDELIWDERAKKLYTDKWVKISTPDEVIYGYGFESNQEFTYWKISKVNGRFNVGSDFKQEF